MTVALTYTLRLLEPILATSLGGDPNTDITYPHIPGSLVRGAVIGRHLSQSARADTDLATDPRFRALFLDGQTRYLNAYLMNDDGHRTLATPLSWYQDKYPESEDAFPVLDKAHPDYDETVCAETFDQPPKQMIPRFFFLDEDVATLSQPETQINIHTQRDRRAGRALMGDGAVFRYEALAAGQRFAGIVLFDDESLVGDIQPLLDGHIAMGGSRSAGYGSVEVEDARLVPDWRETAAESDVIQCGDMFTVCLLSDAILRDAYGQHVDTLDPTTLAAALGLGAHSLRMEKCFKRTALVGGVNRKWGLPLPQMLAVKMGSVFCFSTDADISPKAVASILSSGLGERRAEGFGRLAVNWPGRVKLTARRRRQNEARSSGRKPELKSADGRDLAQSMNERLLRRAADQALAKAINETHIPHGGRPKRSQLGGLRVVIRNALGRGDAAPVVQHFRDMKSTARRQFERGRVQRSGPERSLLDWLAEGASQPEQVWQTISFSPANTPFVGQPVQAAAGLSVEYALRYLDGVLAKASKDEEETQHE